MAVRHEHEKHASAVARGLRELQRPQKERGEEAQDEDDAEEPPLLGDDRQNEVRVLDGQETQLALRAAAESLAREAARADGDLGLADLVAGAEHVGVGVQERADPRLLVVLEEEPARPGHDRTTSRRSRPSRGPAGRRSSRPTKSSGRKVIARPMSGCRKTRSDRQRRRSPRASRASRREGARRPRSRRGRRRAERSRSWRARRAGTGTGRSGSRTARWRSCSPKRSRYTRGSRQTQ